MMRRPTANDPSETNARTRAERRTAGVCPRCGSPLERELETNELTGRPLLRDGATVEIAVCSQDCGYVYRPVARPRRR